MPENESSTLLPPAKLPKPANGQFQKGVCPNPKGRGKGNLSKTTRFLQILTTERQKKALKVLDATLKDAETGDVESRKLVLAMLQPFLKQEAQRDGGSKNKRPLININVGVTEGHRSASPVRVIDAETGEVEE